jgi:hypothetical protein
VKFLKEYWAYILVILILLLAIFWSVFRINKKEVDSQNTQNFPKSKVVKSDGTTVDVRNVYGRVVGWEPKLGVLTVEIKKDDIQDFKIDPIFGKVMVPMSRQGQVSNQLYFFKMASGPHWETAFCLGDNASLQVNDQGNVEVAVNDGRRMCGYIGAWE